MANLLESSSGLIFKGKKYIITSIMIDFMLLFISKNSNSSICFDIGYKVILIVGA